MGQYFGQIAEESLSRGGSKKSVKRSTSHVSSGGASDAGRHQSESNLSTKSESDETKEKVVNWNKANLLAR